MDQKPADSSGKLRHGNGNELRVVERNTALLAKTKGFDWPVDQVYMNEDSDYKALYSLNYYDGDGSGVVTNNELGEPINMQDAVATAPTQQLLQKWLRDEQELEVFVIGNHQGDDDMLLKKYTVWIYKNIKGTRLQLPDTFQSYETALEYGLKQALEELPDE